MPASPHVPPSHAPAPIASALREAVVSFVYGSPMVCSPVDSYNVYYGMYRGPDTRHILECGLEPMGGVDPDSVFQHVESTLPNEYDDDDTMPPDHEIHTNIFLLRDVSCNCGKTWLVGRYGTLASVMAEMLDRSIPTVTRKGWF